MINNNNEKTYNPAPIDVSEIILPSDLTMLIEKLSENVHEIWAINRLNAGWSYGEMRDDFRKKGSVNSFV